jgi:glycine/D-amino acid oxidase-like deaminating enzyme/nitrite reductase/ring-hydroxylating ferredoxin subunit
MHPPYWNLSGSLPRFPRLAAGARADVVVIGGGLTGLTAAYLIKRAGRSVILLERGRLGGFDTSATTAHLTCVTDIWLSDLVSSFGRDHAQAVWDAGLAALAQISECIDEERIDCHFAWVPAFLHTPVGAPVDEAVVERLKQEAHTASELGFDARFVDRAPFVNQPAIEFAEQARFHPAGYLRALAERIDGDGSAIYEETSVSEVTDEPLTVVAGSHRISCDKVVVATHDPIVGKASFLKATLLQSKLSLYTSYVVAGTIEPGRLPDGLFWDTADPYRYLRLDRRDGFDQVIYGGEDYKTGQETDAAERFRTLESALSRMLPGIALTHRWSGQVIETNDGLPYMGEISPRQFVVTGYSGNGMTFGTVAAMMARDFVLDVPNPWAGLFDVGRTKIRGGLWDYIKENKDYPYYLIRDRFAGTEGRSTRAVPRGTGKVITLDGKAVAAYRHSDGGVTLLSATCTHLGCRVQWNREEHTWDCPCHGSRFSPTGDVLSGPAEDALSPARHEEPSGVG